MKVAPRHPSPRPKQYGGMLRVTADEDVGVIGVGDEWAMRAAPLGVVSGAVVVSVTGSSTR